MLIALLDDAHCILEGLLAKILLVVSSFISFLVTEKTGVPSNEEQRQFVMFADLCERLDQHVVLDRLR